MINIGLWTKYFKYYRNLNLMLSFLALVFFVGYILIHVVNGKDTHVRIHDNLDSNIVYYEILSQNNALLTIFDNEQINGMLGEISSLSFGGLWSHRLVRSVFSPFTSYQLLILMQHLIALAGMFWLCYCFLVKDSEEKLLISSVVAVAYGTLPFWPFGGLSVAGLPAATAVIWDSINSKVKWRHVIILFLLALSSALVLTWLFFIPLTVLALLAIQFFTKKQFPKNAWLCLGVFVLFLAATRWIELAGALLVDEPTIRSEFVQSRGGLRSAVKTMVSFFIFGHYHAHSLHYLVIPLGLVGFGAAIGRLRKLPVMMSINWSLLIGIAGIYGLYTWVGVVPVERFIPFIDQLNWSRFHWLVPLLWWCLAALALAEIGKSNRHLFMLLTICLLVGQAGLNTRSSDPINGAIEGKPTYREFFAEEMFTKIRNEIQADKPQALSVAVGMHPSVLQYNSIPTLDGYLSTAPLSKKRLFEQILEKELTKNESIRKYLSNWGARLYIFSDDLHSQSGSMTPQVYKWKNFKLTELEINTDVLIENNVFFVISALPIGNSDELGLKLMDTFQHPDSAWDIWLYKIRDK